MRKITSIVKLKARKKPVIRKLKKEEDFKNEIMSLPLESKSLHDRIGEMLATIGSWMGYNIYTRHKITPEHNQELDDRIICDEIMFWIDAWSIKSVYEMYQSGESFFGLYERIEESRFRDRKSLELI